jgi:hypothetical protein
MEKEQETTLELDVGEEQPEIQRLMQARFLYPGGYGRDGSALFYLIVNRIKLEHVSNINPLVSYIFRVRFSCHSFVYPSTSHR